MPSSSRPLRILTALKQLKREALGANIDLELIRANSSTDFPNLIQGVDVLVTIDFNKEMARFADCLKLIAVPGAGYERIDLDAVPKGVIVCNNYEHENAVSEWVLMAMIALDRQVMRSDLSLRAGSWEMGGRHGAIYPGLEDRTIGVIGFGRIGRRLIELARAFKMRTMLATRSPLSEDECLRYGIDISLHVSDVRRLFQESDFVVPCIPLTGETRGFVNEKYISLMKNTAHIVNIARGEIIEEAALYQALKEQRIAGAALDVWWNEPTSPGSSPKPSAFPFETLDNVLMSPHASAVTESMVRRRQRVLSEQIRRLVEGQELINIVHIGR